MKVKTEYMIEGSVVERTEDKVGKYQIYERCGRNSEVVTLYFVDEGQGEVIKLIHIRGSACQGVGTVDWEMESTPPSGLI